jgi:hypothetical protein
MEDRFMNDESMTLRRLWREFRKPSPRNQDPHHRGATGVWHAALGAIPGLVLADYGMWPMAATIICVVAVYWFKEIGDRSLGGTVADSIEDVFFVGLGAGAAYYDALVGLVLVNIAALAVTAIQTKGGDQIDP